MLKDTFKHLYLVLFLAISALGLSGCSDDDDDDLPLTFVSGTAATGAPIVGTIRLVDVNGDLSDVITIDADGSFSIPVFGLQPPFMLEAEATNSETFYSYAERWGIANVTELTTLAIVMASGTNPEVLFDNWDTQNGSLSDTALNNAAQIIYANLQAEFTAAGLDATDWDIFTDRFNADSTGIDAVLDGVSVTINGTTYTLTDENSNLIAFNPLIDITEIEFDGGTISFDFGNDNDGPNIDVDLDEDLGDWDLTITGTATVNGITTTIPSTTINNIPAPTSVADFESINSSDIESNFQNVSVTKVSETANEIVYTLSYDVSVTITEPITITTTTSTDLTYTYTR